MIELLLGHLVGDYLLQGQEMANRKKEKGFMGEWFCLIHCLLYAMTVMIFLSIGGWISNNIWAVGLWAFVFASHYAVDRFKWLYTIHIRYYKREGIDNPVGALVYIVMDNTIHLVLTYMAVRIVRSM